MLADIAVERGKARARAFGCPFFADYRMMLDAARPDVTVICSPHPFHAVQTIDCLDAGAHVLVEKPLAVSVSEADAMIAAADRAGRILAVCFQQRFRPVIEHARALIERGEIGEIVRVLCVEPWFRTQFYYNSAAWRGTWRGEGGGVLMNQGPHPLDLLCHLPGPPAKVWGRVRTLGHAIECEDVAQALLEYPNGAPGYIYFSTVEAGSPQRTEIAGDRGALINQGIHLVDLLLWLMGDDVVEVQAYTATLARAIEVEDRVSAALRFASGALGAIAATTVAAPGFPPSRRGVWHAGRIAD